MNDLPDDTTGLPGNSLVLNSSGGVIFAPAGVLNDQSPHCQDLHFFY